MKKSILRELVEEIMDEMSTSGAAGPYSTPFAFSGGKKDNRHMKKIAADSMPGGEVIGEEIVASVKVSDVLDETDRVNTLNVPDTEPDAAITEGRYHNFKSSNVMKNHSKVSYGLREAKKILGEIEMLLNLCERLKLETNIDQSQLWKRSKQDIREVHGKLKNIARKIERIGR
jgi:hypothetical protein